MTCKASLKRPRSHIERMMGPNEGEEEEEEERYHHRQLERSIDSSSIRNASMMVGGNCRRRPCPLSPHLLIMSPILFLLILNGNIRDCTALQALQQEGEGNIVLSQDEPPFGSNIKQQQRQGLRGIPLSPSIIHDDLSFEIPKDADVTSPPYRIQVNNTNDTDDEDDDIATPQPVETGSQMTRQNGNPQVSQELPVDAQIALSIEPETDIEWLVQDMEEFLEHYLERQFQQLIDTQGDEFPSSSPILQLQQVDLTVFAVDFPSQRRILHTFFDNVSSRRFLPYNEHTAVENRSLQESSTLAVFIVNGGVAYSVEVDGGSPTPEDIEQEWNMALADFMSQPRLDEAVADAGVVGVIRVDRVSSKSPGVAPEDQSYAATTNSIPNSAATNSTIPWQDSSSADKSSSELTRPSTLSIVFGFLLTGIAALGLLGYCYIFYRKRKKRLRKKQQMKESIAYPARLAASPGRNPNAMPRPQSQGQPPVLPVVAAPMILSPVDETFSEDTSYKGLESSIGSEDASDAFAKELQKAASLDQQAWDEFQRRKEAFDTSQTAQSLEVKTPKNAGKDNTEAAGKARDIPPSLLGKQNLSSDEEGILEYPEGIEADLEGKPSFARSYPYGDEGVNDDDDDWVENPLTPRSQRHHVENRQWEPYNSALPPSPDPISMEEKKDEISPSGFFAKELQNIEMDLARYGGNAGIEDRGVETLSDEERLSNVDMMSEVEAMSKYVRRYEQRKGRKVKREMEVHERFSVGGASSAGTSSMSIGMDGRVYNPYSSTPNLEPSTPSSLSTVSSLVPPQERARGNDLSSYAGSYLNSQQQDGNNGVLSFVSDDDNSEEGKEEDSSLRSQRLGISPFKVSQPDEGYYSSYSKAEKSASTGDPTDYTRGSKIPSSPDDYRYSVGYGYDAGSSNNGRNTDASLSSKSSVRSTNRLSNLRANNAIIDSSNSDINVTYDPYTNRSSLGSATPSSNNSNSTTSKRSGLGRLSFRNDTGADSGAKADPRPSGQLVQARAIPKKTSNNKRFDRLRGMFEQKTTEQPAPIYPPGEHWQYEGHKRTLR